jgi:hypothetical protein
MVAGDPQPLAQRSGGRPQVYFDADGLAPALTLTTRGDADARHRLRWLGPDRFRID